MSSITCTVCGGTSSQIIDGQMFCNICGTQIAIFQEYATEEDTILKGAFKLKAKRTTVDVEKHTETVDELDLKTPGRPKKKKCTVTVPEETEATKKLDDLRNDTVNASERVDDHLHTVGRRLLTFTKILAKVVGTLTEECNFPSTFPETCLALWQLYLKDCEIAFHDTEFETNLDNMYRALVEKAFTAKEIEKSKKNAAKKKKLDGNLALNKSMNPLQLLVSEEIDEDLGLVAEDDPENPTAPTNKVSEICVIDTNINKRAIERASSMYLEPDVLVTIVYTAALAVGCYWVTISDIVRWINEDRFFISTLEYNSMGVLRGNKHTERVFTFSGIPRHEYERIFLWFWQSIEIPLPKIELDMKVIFSRYLYEFNLPTDFMDCIHTLYKLCPMESSISRESVRLQGDITEGFKLRDLKRQSDVIGCFRKTNYKRYTSFTDVFFSLEVKIMAYILLALKLRFGLEEDEDEEVQDGEFSVSFWIYQLKLRLLYLDGHSATDILTTDQPFNSHALKPPFSFGSNMTGHLRKSEDSTSEYFFVCKSREKSFDNSCPSFKRTEQSNMLPPYLPPELCRMTNRSEIGNKVFFAPLRFQANAMRDFMNQSRTPAEKEELKKMIDQDCLKLFLEDFGAYSLPFEGATTWQQIFPESYRFKRYPRPLWAQGALYNYSGKHGQKTYLNGIDQRGFYGPCALFASKKAAYDSYTAASPFMSNSFKTVLESFAKYIGETNEVLYSCYMMLELIVIDHERHSKIVEALVENSTIPLEYALFNLSGTSTKYSGRISTYHKVDAAKDVKCYKLGFSQNYAVDDIEEDQELLDNVNKMELLDIDPSDSEDEKKFEFADEETVSVSESGSSSDEERFTKFDLSAPNLTEYEDLVRRTSRKRQLFSTRVYDWDTVWHILATKYW